MVCQKWSSVATVLVASKWPFSKRGSAGHRGELVGVAMVQAAHDCHSQGRVGGGGTSRFLFCTTAKIQISDYNRNWTNAPETGCE